MRVVHAFAELAVDEGYEAATVPRVCGLAGVSVERFAELFASRDACLEYAYAQLVARARTRMDAAADTSSDWREVLGRRLRALLALLDDEPELARLCAGQAYAGPPGARARRAGSVRELAVALAPPDLDTPARPAPQVAEAVTGAALRLAQRRLFAPCPQPLSAVGEQLLQLISLPFLEPDAVARELVGAGRSETFA